MISNPKNNSTDLSLPAKEETLHVIFLFYFEQLASLPYRLRRKLHGDSYAKKMKRMIKQSDYSDRFDSYWSLFFTQCVPFFLLSMIGEIMVFQSHSYFFQIIGLTLFLIGFVFYIYFAYKLEGWRFLSSLYKWVRYRANPQDRTRPLDAFQALKVSFPLLIAIAAALVKLWQPS